MAEGSDYDPIPYLEKLDRFFDGEEQTTLYFELEKMGCPPPLHVERMSDEEVTRALTDLIWGLFDLHVVIDFADHLTDRELYAELLDYCDEPTVVFPEEPNAWCHWDPDDDWDVYLKYYADPEHREREAKERFPDLLPAAELPPHYRRWLPWRDGIRG